MAKSSSTSEYYKTHPKAKAKRNKQQARYNKTAHGLAIRVAANKADKKSKKNGTGKKGDGLDNSHYPGSKTRTRLLPASQNRGTERQKPKTA